MDFVNNIGQPVYCSFTISKLNHSGNVFDSFGNLPSLRKNSFAKNI